MMQSLKQRMHRYLNPIAIDNLEKIQPISKVFGFDRGTPIDRYYIEKFLFENKKYIKGNILEIAESTYSKKFSVDKNSSYHVLTFDKSIQGKAYIVGDLTDEKTLPKGKMNCFICTQTFNFIYEVQKAIQGAYSVLSDGGVLLATVSGLSQISQYDMVRWGDYWRFTDLSIQKLFAHVFGINNVKIYLFGNLLASIALLQGVVIEDLPNIHLLDEQDRDYQVIIGIIAQKGENREV